MSLNSICRVCLVGDVKMYSIRSELLEIYEKLTSSKISSDDNMPNMLCYICESQLQKCHRFSERALQSEKLLRERLNSSDKAIHELSPCPSLNLKIVNNLSITFTQSIHNDENINYNPETHDNSLCLTEPVIKIEIKKEPIELKSEIQETVQSKGDTKEDLHYNCSICSKKFLSERQLQTHLMRHKQPLSCPRCDRTFFVMHSFRKHVMKCKRQAVACKVCGKAYPSEAILKKHMVTHSDYKPFICDRCSSKFRTKTHLKSHLRVHSGERPFACEACGKAFTQQSNLRTHMLVHTRIKKFACEICGKAFQTNGTLKSHMRSHSGERPFKCTTCDMTFGFKCSLNQHIRRLHVEVKAYACNKCPMSFNQESGLTGHLKTHTSDRPFTCDVCKKTFTSARNLKGHMQVHTGDRPHTCSRCGTAYKRPEHLRAHLKTFKCRSAQP